MGKRGPQRTPIDILEKRGSWRGKARRKAEKKAKQSKPISVETRKPRSINDLDKIIREIPGYDPHAQANGCHFDEDAAKDAIQFFETDLTHVKGEKARKKERFLLERWQQAIIANLFGWKREDGTRRYRKAFIFVARKNGKTPMAAGIVLYGLFRDDEPGAEIYGAAAEYKQASLVFEHARGMVFNNSRLYDRCKVYDGQAKSIQLDSDYSTYRVISADAFSKHGYNSHIYVIDELHAQPNPELLETLETSTAARRQPLAVYITTADYNRPESVCNREYDYACKVRDGIIDDFSYLPVIFEAAPEDDWTDPATWRKANPNLGVSVLEDYIVEQCKKAQEMPAFENTFKRLHLNIRTEQDVRWLPMEKWDAIDAIIDENALKGQECYAGLDLASTTDIAALVLLFPRANGDYHILPFFWVPKEGARLRSRRDRVPYLEWINRGLIRATEGNVIDYDVIRHDINELGKRFNIRELAVDRWNSTQLQTQLEGDGFEIVPFGQGFASMTAPTKEFEGLVLGGKLIHGGHPVMRWMAANVTVETDAAANLKPSKKKSTEKIDGIVAAIMALGRAMVRNEKRQSVYETRGLVTV